MTRRAVILATLAAALLSLVGLDRRAIPTVHRPAVRRRSLKRRHTAPGDPYHRPLPASERHSNPHRRHNP